MSKSDQLHFVPVGVETKNCDSKRKRGNSRNKFQNNRKTPSPQKEYKILQRRSSSNRSPSPHCGSVGRDISPSSFSHLDDSKNLGLINNSLVRNRDSSPKLFEKVDSYAGARFHSPPSPDVLPKPPTHWLNDTCAASVSSLLNAPYLDSIAVHLKGLLNVQA